MANNRIQTKSSTNTTYRMSLLIHFISFRHHFILIYPPACFFAKLLVNIEMQHNASRRDNIVLMIYLVVAISYDFLHPKMQQNTFPKYKSLNWGECMICCLDIEWFAKIYGDISPCYLRNRLYNHVCLFHQYPWYTLPTLGHTKQKMTLCAMNLCGAKIYLTVTMTCKNLIYLCACVHVFVCERNYIAMCLYQIDNRWNFIKMKILMQTKIQYPRYNTWGPDTAWTIVCLR